MASTTKVEYGAGQAGRAGHRTGSFQGTPGLPAVTSSSEPMLIAAALLAVYIILGVLYEVSYIHPLTILSTPPSARASCWRCWRWART